jgi:hypothetical protein
MTAGEHLLTWSVEIAMSERTPQSCKGALGTWPLQEYPDMLGPANNEAPVEANHTAQGWRWGSTCASRGMGRRPAGSQGQNRTGESPPSGIAGGACGNVDHGGTRPPPRVSKERVLETLRLKLCAPQIYPDRAKPEYLVGVERERTPRKRGVEALHRGSWGRWDHHHQ